MTRQVRFMQLVMLALLVTLVSTSHAQVTSELRTGTIEAINQEEGYIVVSGVTVPYDEGGVRLSYREQAVRTTFLRPGLLIRYRLNQNGTIGEIVLMGPTRVLMEIDQH